MRAYLQKISILILFVGTAVLFQNCSEPDQNGGGYSGLGNNTAHQGTLVSQDEGSYSGQSAETVAHGNDLFYVHFAKEEPSCQAQSRASDNGLDILHSGLIIEGNSANQSQYRTDSCGPIQPIENNRIKRSYYSEKFLIYDQKVFKRYTRAQLTSSRQHPKTLAYCSGSAEATLRQKSEGLDVVIEVLEGKVYAEIWFSSRQSGPLRARSVQSFEIKLEERKPLWSFSGRNAFRLWIDSNRSTAEISTVIDDEKYEMNGMTCLLNPAVLP